MMIFMFMCLYMSLQSRSVSISLGLFEPKETPKALTPGIAKGGFKSLPSILRSCSSWAGPHLERESYIEIRGPGITITACPISTPAAVSNKMARYHVEIRRTNVSLCQVPTYQVENRGA